MKRAEKLKYYRQREGLSVPELAEKLHVTVQSVARWEKGKNEPTADNLKRLSLLYGVSIDELLSEDKPRADVPAVEAAVKLPVEEVEITGEKSDEPTVPMPASTKQKLPLRYKIALCSAVALCVLFVVLLTVSKIQQEEENQGHDVRATQEELDTRRFEFSSATEFDMSSQEE